MNYACLRQNTTESWILVVSYVWILLILQEMLFPELLSSCFLNFASLS